MTVKAVILDLDGTLINLVDSSPISGIQEMIADIQGSGLRIAVASNRPGAQQKLEHASLTVDCILDHQLVGANKGSVKWVDAAIRKFNVNRNELVWLGDTDQDMWSAVNGRVIYFNAGWSEPDYDYGFNIETPQKFATIITECFAKELNWYWTVEGSDKIGRPFTARAIIDGSGAGIFVLKDGLISFLKRGGNPSIGPFCMREFIMLHLVGSIYGEGLFAEADVWTIYPSHTGGPNSAMAPFVEVVAQLFRDRYLEDLLIRHTHSNDSGQVRHNKAQGISSNKIDFANQINTVQVNEQYKTRIKGKRIVVVDDFTTEGWSLECARNLLYKAGAVEVVCITIGKYGSKHYIATAAKEYTWNPYKEITHKTGTFEFESTPGNFDPRALEVIRESYERVCLK